MNIDTDTQYAFTRPIVTHVCQNIEGVLKIDGEVGDQQMGLHARLMSKFMRRITGPCSDTNTMLMLINQVRQNLGAYGAPENSTGMNGFLRHE